MLETLRNAWKIEDLRKKIIFTLIMLFIYRLGTFVPVPGVDSSFIKAIIDQSGLLGFFNIISGGAFGNFTIFALSITPYINASIIMNLLTVAIPKLEALAKEGKRAERKLPSTPGILPLYWLSSRQLESPLACSGVPEPWWKTMYGHT